MTDQVATAQSVNGAGDAPKDQKDTMHVLKQFYTQLFVEKMELDKMLAESTETVLSEAVLNMMKEESNNNNLTMIGDLPVDVQEDDKQVIDQMKNIDKVLSGQEEVLRTLISKVENEIQKYRIEESVLIRESGVDSTMESVKE